MQYTYQDAFLTTQKTNFELINFFYIYVFKDFIYLFLERGEGREKERDRNINVWLPLKRSLLGTWPTTQACALTGNLIGNTFGSQPGTQSTEPHQPGLNLLILMPFSASAIFCFTSSTLAKHFLLRTFYI